MSGLPRGWVEVPLEDLCEFNPKHDPKTNRQTTVSFVPMPAVDDKTGTIVDRSTIRPLSEVWNGYTHFADADVIFAKITPCMENGKIAVARGLENGMACGSTEFHVLRSKGAVEPDFVWRFLRQQSYRQVAERSMTGAVGQRRVPKPFLEATVLPLPPLAEQKRIVAKLDALNAKSARARTELARIETLVSRYKQAVLSKAFSGDGLGSIVQEKLQLSEVVVLRTGPFGSALHKSDYIVGGVPLVNPMHIVKGKIQVDPTTSVATTKAEQLEEFRLKAGDVVLARRGEMGRAAVVGEDEDGYLCGTGSMIVRPNPRLSPVYLQRYLSSPPVVRALESAAVGTTMVNLNQSILLSQDIPLPSLQEQHEIVRRIESAFAKIDRLAGEAKRALALVGKLDEAIFAKAFRGELVPQDENDEPAEHLLARIRAERAAAPKARRKPALGSNE